MTPPSLDDTQSRIQASFVIPRNIVAIPSWLAAGFLAVFVLSVAASFVLYFQARGAEERQAARDRILTRELRLLDLGVSDVESVLIRSELAKREDFAQRFIQPTEKEE